MRKFISVNINDLASFKDNLLSWASNFPVCCILDSNGWPGSENELLVAAGAMDETILSKNAFEELKRFHQEKNDWLFGFLSYDLKNEIENLSSEHFDGVGFPQMHFFQPNYIFRLSPARFHSSSPEGETEQREPLPQQHTIEVGFLTKSSSEKEIENIVLEISTRKKNTGHRVQVGKINSRISKEEYICAINKIREHIHRGDIYEMNYCMEFFAKEAQINPADVFRKLNRTLQTPFSSFYRLGDKYLMCASPERFLKKSGNKIISQPIKGTAKRGENNAEDTQIKKMLPQNKKERSENVMIVDLVRNDLSKTCHHVKAEELFKVSSFIQWHQMISTVSGEIRKGVHFADVIKNAFPMGSMTGAPKVRTMELIEKYERTKRGLYAGAVGYITPPLFAHQRERAPHPELVMGREKGKGLESDGDFDFNVVIRSILHNSSSGYLSFQVGSAITIGSIPEKEYNECVLKAKGMFEALGIHPEESKKEKMTPHPHV